MMAFTPRAWPQPEPDWRKLERFRRLMHPEIRGVSWRCEHGPGEPTDGRGPVNKNPKFHKHVFTLIKGGKP